MKTASAALISFLGSYQPFIGADLYTITLFDGTVTRLTSLDRNVTYTGANSLQPDFGTHIYLSLGQTGAGQPMIQRSALSMAVGLNPSKIDLEIFSAPGALIEGQAILTGIAQGKWVNANVFVRRAFILPGDVPANWNTPVPTNLGGAGDGTLLWFNGYVGKVSELGPLNAKMEVRDLLWYLNRPLPKNLFGPGCYHKLFDAGCTLSASSYTATGSPLTGSTSTVVNTNLTNDQNVPSAPSSAPGMSSAVTKYALPAVTYYAQVTYVTALGETVPSPVGSLACVPNRLLTVSSPPSVTGSSFWNVYVGTELNDEQKQNGDPIPLSTASWTMPTGGIYLGGIAPPNFPTNGYWSLGVLTVTYASGALSGQIVSAFIETSVWDGTKTILTLRVPLPQAPTTSDSFSVIPGCDKAFTTCQGKFGNLVHFSGFPFTPNPEAGA